MKQSPEAKAAQKAIAQVGIKKTGHERGGPTELAKILGLTRQRIYQFARDGIPMGYVIQVEQASGVSREELCPEMFAKKRTRSAPKQKQPSKQLT